MFDQLDSFIIRYDELSELLSDPDVISDTRRFMELTKEEAALRPKVEVFRRYQRVEEELAETEELYERPMHPYTEALLSAIPTTDIDNKKEPIILEGDVPSPINPPSGCKFHTRCQYATEICIEVEPEFEEVTPGHFVACHHKRNVEDI